MIKAYGILIRTDEDNKSLVKTVRKEGWACHRIEYEEEHIKVID